MAEERITLDEAATIVGLSRRLLDHRIAFGHLAIGEDGLVAMADVLALKEREDRRNKARAEIGRDTDEQETAFGDLWENGFYVRPELKRVRILRRRVKVKLPPKPKGTGNR